MNKIVIVLAFFLFAAAYQAVRTDGTTLTGGGSDDDPLGVDTSYIATQYDLDGYVLADGKSGGQAIIGGTGTTDDLTLQVTSNGSAVAGADMHFLVGSSGGTEAMTILNSGYVGINQTAPAMNFVVNSNPSFGGINETVAPFTGYSSQNTGYIQIGTGTATANANSNYPDLNFVHNLTSVSGDKVAGGFKFLNKSTGSSETRLAQLFCWAEGAVNKGAFSFYTHDGSSIAERLRIANTGLIGIGAYSSLSAQLTIRSSLYTQLRLEYNTSNYFKIDVGSSGGVTFDATGSGAGFTFSDKVTLSNPLKLKSYTVATLPAGTTGDMAYVTDATAPTYLGTLTGGGSVVCPVFYNGTAWVSH